MNNTIPATYRISPSHILTFFFFLGYLQHWQFFTFNWDAFKEDGIHHIKNMFLLGCSFGWVRMGIFRGFLGSGGETGSEVS